LEKKTLELKEAEQRQPLACHEPHRATHSWHIMAPCSHSVGLYSEKHGETVEKAEKLNKSKQQVSFIFFSHLFT
jgi:hypothetical protein